MTKYVLYGIEYNSTKYGYDEIGVWRSIPTGGKELYCSTNSGGCTLFDTKGKANARLKTHFKNGEDERKARVVKFELKEIEE